MHILRHPSQKGFDKGSSWDSRRAQGRIQLGKGNLSVSLEIMHNVGIRDLFAAEKKLLASRSNIDLDKLCSLKDTLSPPPPSRYLSFPPCLPCSVRRLPGLHGRFAKLGITSPRLQYNDQLGGQPRRCKGAPPTPAHRLCSCSQPATFLLPRRQDLSSAQDRTKLTATDTRIGDYCSVERPNSLVAPELSEERQAAHFCKSCLHWILLAYPPP